MSENGHLFVLRSLCYDFSLANIQHFSEISCPDPVVGNARPVNVWYKPVKYMYGDTVSISCNEGYTIRDYGSNVVLRCTNKGTWDPAVTECTSGRQLVGRVGWLTADFCLPQRFGSLYGVPVCYQHWKNVCRNLQALDDDSCLFHRKPLRWSSF